MLPIYRTLSGNYNPSYITTSLQQSGVDTKIFVGESVEEYAYDIDNNLTNDVVISANDQVGYLSTTTKYNFLSVLGSVTNFGLTFGSAVLSCTHSFNANFILSYLSAYSLTNANIFINPVYGTGFTNITSTSDSKEYTIFFNSSGTSPNRSVFTIIQNNTSSLPITASTDVVSQISVINDILLSGNNLIFAGMFQNNVTNIYDTQFFDYPTDSFNYTNIAIFDKTINRLRKLSNIGTFTGPMLSSTPNSLLYDRVFTLALCGSNLVAGGKFNLINTEITGFINLDTPIPVQPSLSGLGSPFNSVINVGDVLSITSYKILITNPPTIFYNRHFYPTYSGDPCQNIAFYSNSLNKWLPFTNTRELPGRVRSIAVRNNTVYTTGRSYSGAILFHNGSDWQFLSNSFTMSSYSNNYLNLSSLTPPSEPLLASLAFKMEGTHLNYSQYNDRLLLCGIFSGYDTDYRKSGIMAYDFNSNTFVSLGSGIELGWTYCSVVCGENIVVTGPYSDYNLNLSQPAFASFLPPGPNQVFRDLCDLDKDALAGIYNCSLCGTNILLGGYYQKFDSLGSDQNFSFVTYVDKNLNLKSFNVLPSGPFSNTNPYIDPFTQEIVGYTPNVLKVFDYIKLNYTVNSNISADFVSESLYNNESLIGVNGIGVFGNSTYLGISGINVDF